jgi:hypothetical protein
VAGLPPGLHIPTDILIGMAGFQKLPPQGRADGGKLVTYILQLPGQAGVIQLETGNVFQQAKAFTSAVEVGIDNTPVDPGFTV